MKLREATLLGASNVRRHKLRSVLTTLGIIMGVAAVIGTVTLIASFQAYFEQQFSGTLRPEAFAVAPGELRTTPGPQSGLVTAPLPIFTDRDVQEIQKLTGVRVVIPFGVIPLVPGQGVQIGNSSVALLQGVSASATIPDAFSYGLVKLGVGRGINASSDLVVGYSVAQAIAKDFGSNSTQDALGKQVRLNFASGRSYNFTVVGVLEQLPFSTVNSQVNVDLRTYYSQTRALPGSSDKVTVYSTLTVSASSLSGIKTTEDAVMSYLSTQSDAEKFLKQDSAGLGFVIISQEAVISLIQTQLSEFGSVLGSVGVISLLVGSIGIANTMMVSVTERTREIGVMKATGARKRDILQLFLLEASMISGAGSVVGVAVGILLGNVLTQSSLFGGFHLPLTFRLEWFPIAIGVGILVGVLSGLYPAWRAARVDPVEALRYE